MVETIDMGFPELDVVKSNRGRALILSRYLLKRIEQQNDCEVLLAGFVGSRMIGLSMNASDYDIKAIVDRGQVEPRKLSRYSFPRYSCDIDIWTYRWDKVAESLEEWEAAGITLPSIHSDAHEDLVHSDDFRSQIRLASEHCIVMDVPEDCERIMHLGLAVKDGLDYQYTRAFLNYVNYLEQDKVGVRKYLYTLYELFAIRWIADARTYPPPFTDLLLYVAPEEMVWREISKLYDMNGRAPKEENHVSPNHVINEYIFEELRAARARIETFAKLGIRYEFNVNYE